MQSTMKQFPARTHRSCLMTNLSSSLCSLEELLGKNNTFHDRVCAFTNY